MTNLLHTAIRQPKLIAALVLMPCKFSMDWTLLPSDKVVTLSLEQLLERYPARNFLYAKGGDYVGAIRRGSGLVVDFQISPHHENLRDPRWTCRVVEVARVVRVIDVRS